MDQQNTYNILCAIFCVYVSFFCASVTLIPKKTDLIADLLGDKADVLFPDPRYELRVLPAENRRQRDEQRQYPDEHQHEEDPFRRPILHVVDVRDAPVPVRVCMCVMKKRIKEI